MLEIYILLDYKGRFGLKHFDKPYRSGFDKDLIKKYFNEKNINPTFNYLADVLADLDEYKDKYVLYTSSEDPSALYKSYIEDLILGLEESGAVVIPAFKYLRAHNNKVLMEFFRKQLNLESWSYLETKCYGTYEECKNNIDKIPEISVIKKAEGASGKNVFLAKNKASLLKIVKEISRSKNLFYELWDLGRSYKHAGYIRDSRYRNKYIIQNFVPNLKNDWKVYVFGNRYYIFYRPLLRGRGFRASGGGYENYLYGEKAPRPEGIFDFAKNIYEKINTPHLSLDIAYDGKRFYLIEFQCIYFGTAGILFSDNYYSFSSGNWEVINEKLEIEKVYVDSIDFYLKRYF